MKGLLYLDARHSSGFNTGSDLFPQKSQDGFTVVNGRVGFTGADERWALEIWAQNLLNKNYQQVAFNSPFQEGAVGAPVHRPAVPGRTADLLVVPRRAEDLRPDAAGALQRSARGTGRGGTSASAAAAAAAGHADLRGRIGDPGDRGLPGPAATAASAAAGARARLIGASNLRRGSPEMAGPFSYAAALAVSARRCGSSAPAADRSSSASSSAVAAGQIEDVDRALAIGGDMGGMDDEGRIRGSPGQAGKQCGPVARIDLDHRRPARRALGNRDGRRHPERRRSRPLARRRGSGGAASELSAVSTGSDQPVAQPAVGISAALPVLHEQIVERHAVARRVDPRIDDVRAGRGKPGADAVEQALAVGREHADPGRAAAASSSATTFGTASPICASAEATCRALASCHSGGSASQ